MEPPSATACHTNLPSSLILLHPSVSVSSNFCLTQLRFLCNAHSNCSCSIMMINKDSLSHAALQMNSHHLLFFLRNETFSPNCAIGFLHLGPFLLISLVFPSLPILIFFMTCAAKRGGQLSNGLSPAIRTLVFCSAGIRRVPHCRFHFSHRHYFNTTVGHVITLRWSPME